MLAGIHQLHYLPWLRYFEKIARCDVFVVLDNIQYNKNGWQNRNRVKSAQGALLLTAPVLARLGDTLDVVRLNNDTPWRKKHKETLRQCYAKAPFFAQYADFIEETYERAWDRLNDLNRHMLTHFAKTLGIETRIVYASDLNVAGVATERLVNLVRAVGCDAYYTGEHAAGAYLDAAAFGSAGIELIVQRWTAPAYPQLYGPFVADLSIVDLLMNAGPDALAMLKAGGGWN